MGASGQGTTGTLKRGVQEVEEQRVVGKGWRLGHPREDGGPLRLEGKDSRGENESKVCVCVCVWFATDECRGQMT